MSERPSIDGSQMGDADRDEAGRSATADDSNSAGVDDGTSAGVDGGDSAGVDGGDSARVDDGDSAASASSSLSDNLVFAAVDSPRRRFVLYSLQEKDGVVDIDELVEAVTEFEREMATDAEDANDGDVEDPQQVFEDLLDRQLPDLRNIGVVDYDESNGTVELGPYADELDIDGFDGAAE